MVSALVLIDCEKGSVKKTPPARLVVRGAALIMIPATGL